MSKPGPEYLRRLVHLLEQSREEIAPELCPLYIRGKVQGQTVPLWSGVPIELEVQEDERGKGARTSR